MLIDARRRHTTRRTLRGWCPSGVVTFSVFGITALSAARRPCGPVSKINLRTKKTCTASQDKGKAYSRSKFDHPNPQQQHVSLQPPQAPNDTLNQDTSASKLRRGPLGLNIGPKVGLNTSKLRIDNSLQSGSATSDQNGSQHLQKGYSITATNMDLTTSTQW